jgi:Fe-S cluster biogenesis protein NfuA
MTNTEKASLLERINLSVDSLRPYLQADGGDITVEDITDDMTVQVKFLGACISCPFSFSTLKAGIEQTLKKDFPELKEVVLLES